MKRGKGNVQVTFEEEGQAYALFKTIDTHLKSVGFEVNVQFDGAKSKFIE